MQQTSSSTQYTPDSVERITVDEIKKREAAGEQFTFIDTRNPKAWGESDQKITGALRIPLDDADQQMADINKDQAIVTYCT